MTNDGLWSNLFIIVLLPNLFIRLNSINQNRVDVRMMDDVELVMVDEQQCENDFGPGKRQKYR